MKKIIVVEDEEAIRDLIATRLTAAGYSVSTAPNGAEALRKIQREPQDLVISDILMPEMDGFELHKQIKKDPKTKTVPVLILTARGKMMDTFQTFGVDGFITKPFQADQLIKQVADILEHREPQTPSKTPLTSTTAAPAPKTALAIILCDDRTITAEISSHLKTQNYTSIITTDESGFLHSMANLNPQIVILQINQETASPLNVLVAKIKQQAPKGQTVTPKIILFKIEQTLDGTSSVSGEMAAIETLVDQCLENGADHYLGTYASFSFGKKIQPFL